MSKIQELREKRAKVWEQAKGFLDEHRQENGLIKPEDNACLLYTSPSPRD